MECEYIGLCGYFLKAERQTFWRITFKYFHAAATAIVCYNCAYVAHADNSECQSFEALMPVYGIGSGYNPLGYSWSIASRSIGHFDSGRSAPGHVYVVCTYGG